MDIPFIYSNGCSFSAEDYHPTLTGKTYTHEVANHYGGFAMNKARCGSCNRRIIRTTVHDMIHQRTLNPEQKIVALIQITVPVRSEIWIDNNKLSFVPEESNLISIQFANKPDWKQRFLNGLGIDATGLPAHEYQFSQKYFNKLTHGLAYFHSNYAETINVWCDLIMLGSLLDSLKVDFLFFSGPRMQKFESDYLLDFFKNRLQSDPRYIDMEQFGFCSWSSKQGFIPLDPEPNPYVGHYGPDAHQAFAEKILIPKLTELSIL